MRDPPGQHERTFDTLYGTKVSVILLRDLDVGPPRRPIPLRPTGPVRRPPVVMRDCQDVNLVLCDQIGEVVGIARHRRSPNVEGFRQSLHFRSGCGP